MTVTAPHRCPGDLALQGSRPGFPSTRQRNRNPFSQVRLWDRCWRLHGVWNGRGQRLCARVGRRLPEARDGIGGARSTLLRGMPSPVQVIELYARTGLREVPADEPVVCARCGALRLRFGFMEFGIEEGRCFI